MPTKKLPKRSVKHFGWLPDLPDHRDLVYKIVKPRAVIKSVDLRSNNIMPAIFDQGNLGSCTANAISFLITFLSLNKSTQHNTRIKLPFSRLFIYYNERDMEGTIGEDSGAYIRDGIKSVAKLGCCGETSWKYDIAKFTKKPPTTAFKSALNYQAIQYERIDNTNKQALFDCLAQGKPFVFGFSVYESFESATVAKTGVVPLPKNSEQLLGGHAVCCVGYDLSTDRFIVANSWGTDWAQNGYFTIPASYLTNANLSDDFWTIKIIE